MGLLRQIACNSPGCAYRLGFRKFMSNGKITAERELDDETASECFTCLRDEIDFLPDSATVVNGYTISRRQAVFCDTDVQFRFGLATLPSTRNWHPLARLIGDNLKYGPSGHTLICQVDYYADHRSFSDYNRDNSSQIVADSTISILNLGQERLFEIEEFGELYQIPFKPGFVISMRDPTCKHFAYRIPVSDHVCRDNMTLTFRSINVP